ncbi:YdcF family protein [Mariniblastus sp.]|nr:YdcF family protein [Mariniblastus sp.]
MNYSAIIVLGNLMSKDGKLNEESTNRMELAIDRFVRNDAPYLITCGWDYRADSAIAIADAMSQFAIESGKVPPASIILANQSRDTVGDAIFSKQIIQSKSGWTRLLIVTSDYHVARTLEIFNFIYSEQYDIEVIGATTAAANEQVNSESSSLVAFRKTFAGVVCGDDESIYKRLCKDHPFYNGVVHPKL